MGDTPIRASDEGVAALAEPHDAVAAAVGAPASGDRWSSLRTLWGHAAGLLVLLSVLLPVIHNGFIALPDEGVYSAQAQNLSNGSWAGPRPAPDVDPDGTFDALIPSAIIGERDVPHARNPIYPGTLWVAYELAGTLGLLLVSILGTWAAAVSAAFLARRLRPQYGIPALWLCGLGSPLVFSAFVVMGHSLTAAACGLLLLAVTVTLDDRRYRLAPLVAAATALLVAVRSEGLVVATAVGGIVLLMGLPIPRRRDADRAGVALGLIILTTAAVSFVCTTWWATQIVSTADAGQAVTTIPADRGPASAAWVSLLRPWESGFNAEVGGLLMVLGVALAAVCLRVVPQMRVLAMGLLAIAVVGAGLLLVRPPNLITGLLPAFPIVFAAIFLTSEDLRRPPVLRLVGVAALSSLGLVATMYSDGGASQWGGRFFHVLIPIVVPLVVLGLDRARTNLAPKESVAAGACLVLVSLSLTTVALRTNAEYRQQTERIVVGTRAALDARPGEGRQLVVYGPMQGDGIGRSFWSERDEMEILSAGDPRLILPIVGNAAEAGVERVLVLTTMDAPSLQLFDRGVLERIGWSTTEDIKIRAPWRLLVLEATEPAG